MSVLLWIYVAVKMVCFIGLFVFLFGYYKYSNSVKGSHGRYVGRSIVRYTQWLAIADQATSLVTNIGTMDFWVVPFNIYNLYWIGKFVKEFYDSDEDDWFKKTKKKLASWFKRKLESVRSRVPSISPLPAPSLFVGKG